MATLHYVQDIKDRLTSLDERNDRRFLSVLMNLSSRMWCLCRESALFVRYNKDIRNVAFRRVEMSSMTGDALIRFSEAIDIIRNVYGFDIQLHIKIRDNYKCSIICDGFKLYLYSFCSRLDSMKYTRSLSSFVSRDFITDRIFRSSDSMLHTLQHKNKDRYDYDQSKTTELVFTDEFMTLTDKIDRFDRLVRMSFIFDKIINCPFTVAKAHEDASCIICLESFDDDTEDYDHDNNFCLKLKCCSKLFHLNCFRSFVLKEIQSKQNPECFLPCNKSVDDNLYVLKFF